jgi:hypothetical protein
LVKRWLVLSVWKRWFSPVMTAVITARYADTHRNGEVWTNSTQMSKLKWSRQ